MIGSTGGKEGVEWGGIGWELGRILPSNGCEEIEEEGNRGWVVELE